MEARSQKGQNYSFLKRKQDIEGQSSMSGRFVLNALNRTDTIGLFFKFCFMIKSSHIQIVWHHCADCKIVLAVSRILYLHPTEFLRFLLTLSLTQDSESSVSVRHKLVQVTQFLHWLHNNLKMFSLLVKKKTWDLYIQSTPTHHTKILHLLRIIYTFT